MQNSDLKWQDRDSGLSIERGQVSSWRRVNSRLKTLRALNRKTPKKETAKSAHEKPYSGCSSFGFMATLLRNQEVVHIHLGEKTRIPVYSIAVRWMCPLVD